MTNKASGSYYEPKVRDYISLLKPRVMSLVVFTGLIGLLLAPGDIHPFIALVAILCIALGSGAAGAINMWYERDIDVIMNRTKKRAIPSGKIKAEDAFDFSIVMAALSVFVMAVVVNYISAVLLLLAILFYVFIYTIWLKRRTPQNIVIGGAAGAFPPVIGWSAVTGYAPIESWVLFAIIFLWTPPHFWALSLFFNEDYKKAGIPMLTVTKGNDFTRRRILYYSLVLFISSLLPYYLGMSGLLYLIAAVGLGVYFVYLAVNLLQKYEEKKARKLFKYSILYLFLLFSIMLIDKLI